MSLTTGSSDGATSVAANRAPVEWRRAASRPVTEAACASWPPLSLRARSGAHRPQRAGDSPDPFLDLVRRGMGIGKSREILRRTRRLRRRRTGAREEFASRDHGRAEFGGALGECVGVDIVRELQPHVVAAVRKRRLHLGQFALERRYHPVAVNAIHALHLLDVLIELPGAA